MLVLSLPEIYVTFFLVFQMVEYLKNVSKENDNAKLLNLGQSYEGRDMLAIAVSKWNYCTVVYIWKPGLTYLFFRI